MPINSLFYLFIFFSGLLSSNYVEIHYEKDKPVFSKVKSTYGPVTHCFRKKKCYVKLCLYGFREVSTATTMVKWEGERPLMWLCLLATGSSKTQCQSFVFVCEWVCLHTNLANACVCVWRPTVRPDGRWGSWKALNVIMLVCGGGSQSEVDREGGHVLW